VRNSVGSEDKKLRDDKCMTFLKAYNNPPQQQRLAQRLLDQFNADEQLWRSLAWKRIQRRRLHPHLSAKRHSLLDLLEFDKSRPPQDCIGTLP